MICLVLQVLALCEFCFVEIVSPFLINIRPKVLAIPTKYDPNYIWTATLNSLKVSGTVDSDSSPCSYPNLSWWIMPPTKSRGPSIKMSSDSPVPTKPSSIDFL